MKSSEIKIGVLITYITLIVGNLISIIYTPYMVGKLGQSEYGLISFVNSIIAYISLIDSGFGSAIIRYNSLYICQKDVKKQNSLNGFFLELYTGFGIVCLIIGAVLCLYMGEIFDKYTMAELWIAKRLMIVATINLAVSFPLNVFSSIIIANERFTYQKGLNLIKTISGPILSIAVLANGGRSIALLLIGLMWTLIVGVLNIIYCFLKLHTKIKFEKVDNKLMKEIVKYAFFIFLSMVGYQIYWNTDQFIIGKVMGAVPIAIYAMGMNFNTYFMAFSDFASSIFLPRFTKKVQNNDLDIVMDDLISVSKLQLYICGLIYTGFVIFGKSFITMWVGKGYDQSYFIALVVMTPQIISIIQSLFATLLQSLNKHNIKAYIYLGMACINIVLTMIFVNIWGVVGCAIGTAIGMVLNAFCNNVYYAFKLKLNMRKYWKALFKPIGVISVYAVSIYVIAIRRLCISTYPQIIILAVLYTLIYALVVWFVAMDVNERKLILGSIHKNKE